jgi:peptidoglycan hydrolase CwlO-like protein
MRDIKSTILLLIIIGLAGYNIFFTKQLRTDIDGYNSKIDSIQTEVDSVVLVNKELDRHIDKLHQEVLIVDKNVTSVQNKITTIKEKTNEKVNNVDNYAIHDLYQFFSNRYENGLDSSVKSSGSKTSN